MKKDCYENLANAIIIQAVNDYVKAIQALAKNKNNTKAKRIEAETLTFFYSQRFTALTDINPDTLINKIHKEVFDNDNKAIFKSGKIS